MFVINPRQQNAEFRCDTGPGLLLQAAFAQDTFEKGVAFNQAYPGDAGSETVSDFTFERCFPARGEAIIDPEIGSEQRALGCFAKVLDRAQLDFDLPGFRDGRISTVEWTIGPCCAAPAGKCSRSSQHSGYAEPRHGAGRNTQIAAGSPDLARAATKSRSSSEAKREVRAPDIVGICASRR